MHVLVLPRPILPRKRISVLFGRIFHDSVLYIPAARGVEDRRLKRRLAEGHWPIHLSSIENCGFFSETKAGSGKVAQSWQMPSGAGFSWVAHHVQVLWEISAMAPAVGHDLAKGHFLCEASDLRVSQAVLVCRGLYSSPFVWPIDRSTINIAFGEFCDVVIEQLEGHLDRTGHSQGLSQDVLWRCRTSLRRDSVG